MGHEYFVLNNSQILSTNNTANVHILPAIYKKEEIFTRKTIITILVLIIAILVLILLIILLCILIWLLWHICKRKTQGNKIFMDIVEKSPLLLEKLI